MHDDLCGIEKTMSHISLYMHTYLVSSELVFSIFSVSEFEMVSDRVKKISPELEFDETFAYDFKHLYLFKEANFVKSASSIKDKLAINSKNYLIAKAFHPLFRIMQILGSLPISIKSTNGMIHYEFHPCSPVFVYSWCSLLAMAVLTFEFILNREFRIDWPFQM